MSMSSRRMRDLQTGHYQHLKLFYSIDCGPHAGATERMAHAMLRQKRRSGEWFSVGVEEAKATVERALEAVMRGDDPPIEAKPEKSKKPRRSTVDEEFHPRQSKDIPTDEDVALLTVLMAFGQRKGQVDGDFSISEVHSKIADLPHGKMLTTFESLNGAIDRIMRFWVNYSSLPNARKYRNYGLYPQTRIFCEATLDWNEDSVGYSLSSVGERLMREHGVYTFFRFVVKSIKEARRGKSVRLEQAA